MLCWTHLFNIPHLIHFFHYHLFHVMFSPGFMCPTAHLLSRIEEDMFRFRRNEPSCCMYVLQQRSRGEGEETGSPEGFRRMYREQLRQATKEEAL